MEITLTGTGTPIPMADRNGMSIHVAGEDDQLLVDCGPGTVHGLLDAGIDPTNVEKLLFTHHHMDHNVEFFQFVIGTWVVGRSALSIWGPAGTHDLHDGLHSAFEQDLRARETVGDRSQAGLTDVTANEFAAGASLDVPQWEVTTLEVDHVEGLETVAYRIEEPATGQVVVYSGDTRPVDGMADFACGADVLIHDSTLAPYAGETPDDEVVWEQFTEIDQEFYDHLAEIHSTPEQAGSVAAAAGVETLVLTHLLPYRDEQAMKDAASDVFDGRVLVASDGLTVSPSR